MRRSDNSSNREVDELGKFADPFLLPSKRNLPMSMVTAFDYCRFLFNETPLYKAVVKRTVAHFVTDLEYRGDIGSPKERKDFTQFFTEEIGGMEAIHLLGLDHGCFGNGLLRVVFPFIRTLIDRRHIFGNYTLSNFPEELVQFDLAKMAYMVPDPLRVDLSTDKRPMIELTPRDTPSTDYSKIRLMRMDPRYVRLRYEDWSGATQVQWAFNPEHRNRIKRGSLFAINRTPINILQCIAGNTDFLFDEESVFHLKNPTVSGVSNDGWGIPEILTQYPSIHKIAVYNRIDETIGHDFLMPFRILTPGIEMMGDQRLATLADEWGPAANRMINEQRLDRTKIHAFPFPCDLKSMGGDGKALVPKDLKELEVKHLLDNMCYPEEIMRGTMNAQFSPTAIRMFESAMYPLSQGLRNATRHVVQRITKKMFGEAFDGTLRSPRVVEDMDRRAMISNYFAAGELSRRVAFDGIVDDPSGAKIERAKEDLEIQKGLRQLEQDAQREATLGSLDQVLDTEGGGAEQAGPTGGAGGAAITPTDQRARAEQLAQQWLAIPSDGQRSQAMQQVRATDADLYAVAKDIMEQMRRQGESEGRQAVAQQAQQPGGQPQG